MSERSTAHDTMVLERHYEADTARVFDAWANQDAKRVWFQGGEPADGSEYRLDFRVNGHEISRGVAPDGNVYTYDAEYRDIVPNERIVYVNHMLRGDTRISVSLTSVEFLADGSGTKLVLTEHGVYLDGGDKPEYRTKGISDQLDALGRSLEVAAPAR
ncbi:MAG: SRPBCC family protein [Humibacter sp.]